MIDLDSVESTLIRVWSLRKSQIKQYQRAIQENTSKLGSLFLQAGLIWGNNSANIGDILQLVTLAKFLLTTILYS